MEAIAKRKNVKVFENKLNFPETNLLSLVKIDQEFEIKFLSQQAKIIIASIAQLTNALADIQNIQGDFLNAHLKDELLKAVLSSLTELKEELKLTAYQYQGLEYLIKYYQNECSYDEYSALLPYFLNHEIIILCGPLATWHWKSDAKRYSFIFALPQENVFLSEDVDGLIIHQLKNLINATGQENLSFIDGIPDYRLYNLVSCAGEANTHPKHFSYFLPENLGVLHNPKNTTVVFMNIYEEIFNNISLPLSQEFISGCKIFNPDEIIKTLLLWFRGHDCGHALGFPETSYKKLSKEIGYQNTMTVSECVADLFGFYIVNALADFHQIPLEKASFVHISEMLRYLSRGLTKWYPDSDAAKIQFNFLVKNNFVCINTHHKIEFSFASFYEGIVSLMQTFYPMVFKLDNREINQFLNTYLYDETDEIKHFYEKLNKFVLPFSFEYNFKII